MVVYIAGPMRGTADLGRARFREMARRVEDRGDIALNPGVLPIGMPVERYMPICLAMLREADAILMLDGWADSAGARIEYAYALQTRKRFLYEEDMS